MRSLAVAVAAAPAACPSFSRPNRKIKWLVRLEYWQVLALSWSFYGH